MAKDYKNRGSVKPKKSGPKWRSEFIIAVILAVIAIGIYGFYAHQEGGFSKAGFIDWIENIKSKLTHRSVVIKSSDSQASPDQNNNVRFDFYSELPAMQVKVPQTAESKAPPKPISPAKQPAKAGYVLDMGVFNSPAEAGQLRISLLLAGIEADVVKEQVNGHDVYHVQQGPYDSSAAAKTAQHKAQQKGFVSDIKKQDGLQNQN